MIPLPNDQPKKPDDSPEKKIREPEFPLETFVDEMTAMPLFFLPKTPASEPGEP